MNNEKEDKLGRGHYWKEVSFAPDTDSDKVIHIQSCPRDNWDEEVILKVADADLKTPDHFRMNFSLNDARVLHKMLGDVLEHQEGMAKDNKEDV